MKKLLLSIAIVAFGLTATAQTEGFNVGANAVYNTDAESFGVMIEANYLFSVSDEFKVGPTVGYQHIFGETQTFDTGFGTFEVDSSFGQTLVGAAARYNVSDEFVLGADLGVGIATGTSDFYYRPLVGYMLGESSMVQLSYPASNGSGSIALGVMFGF